MENLIPRPPVHSSTSRPNNSRGCLASGLALPITDGISAAPVHNHNILETEATNLLRRLTSAFRFTEDETQLYGLSHYRHVSSCLQHGPMCGFVVLLMANTLLHDLHITVDDIYNVAKEHGFTKQGELFAVSHLKTLAEEVLRCRQELIKEEDERRDKIIEALLAGNPVLIPYDADSNHEPCCKDGRKSHWAILTGLLRVTADIGSDVVRENHRSHDDSDELLAATAPHRVTLADVKTADHRDSLYVYATQGKSRHTRLWSLDQLLRSNSNLRLVDPKIERAMAQYCLTPDGVRDGLQNQLIILST